MIISEEVCGRTLTLDTGEYYFSPQGIDKGTRLMLSHTEFHEGDKVLDLGCGYGVVGVLAAKLLGASQVWMCDILEDAVALSKANLLRNGLSVADGEKAGVTVLKSDGLKEITDYDYTLILSNPPYHTDFSVAKAFIEDSFRKLSVGGRLMMVTKRLDWYKNKLTSVFGGVKVYEEEGYYVFLSEKRQAARHIAAEKPKQRLSKKLQRKYGNAKKPGGRR